MKKLIYFAAAAIAFVGCSKQEITDQAPSKGIGFESFIGKPSSKAAPVTAFVNGDKMLVWGYLSDAQMGTTLGSATAIPNLGGVSVTKGASGWTYSPAAYWHPDKCHSFFAVTPDTISVASGVATIRVANSVANQKDLMVADPIKLAKYTDGAEAPQSFKFRHVLSQIKFAAKIVETEVSVTNVQITSVVIAPASGQFANSGTVSIVAKADDNAYTYASTATGSVASYTVTPTAAVTLNTSTYSDVFQGASDVAMLLPQSVSALTITLNISYTQGGSTLTKAVTVNVASNPTWAPNMIYKYNFDISVPKQVLGWKPITFGEPTIVAWGSETTPSI